MWIPSPPIRWVITYPPCNWKLEALEREEDHRIIRECQVWKDLSNPPLRTQKISAILNKCSIIPIQILEKKLPPSKIWMSRRLFLGHSSRSIKNLVKSKDLLILRGVNKLIIPIVELPHSRESPQSQSSPWRILTKTKISIYSVPSQILKSQASSNSKINKWWSTPSNKWVGEPWNKPEPYPRPQATSKNPPQPTTIPNKKIPV